MHDVPVCLLSTSLEFITITPILTQVQQIIKFAEKSVYDSDISKFYSQKSNYILAILSDNSNNLVCLYLQQKFSLCSNNETFVFSYLSRISSCFFTVSRVVY